MPSASLTKKTMKVMQRLLISLRKADTIDEEVIFRELAGGLLTYTSNENKEQGSHMAELLNDAFSLLRTKFPESYRRLVRRLHELSQSNHIVLSNVLNIYMEDKNFTAMVDVLHNNPEIEITPTIIEALREGCVGAKNSANIARVISERRIYDKYILERYLEHHTRATSLEIISNYSKASDSINVEVLKNFWNTIDDARLKLNLIELLMKTDSEETESYLKAFPVNALQGVEECEKACELFGKSHYLEGLWDVIERCLKMYPDNVYFLKAKGDALYNSGKLDLALQTYMKLIRVGYKDTGITRKAIEMNFNKGRFKACLDLIQNTADSEIRKDFTTMAIECKIRLLRFNDALTDIEDSLSRSPDNIDLLTLKLDLSKRTGKIMDSYETAKRILDLDHGNKSALDYLSGYYFERGEFEKLIEILQRSGVYDVNSMSFFLASLIYEGRIKQAMEILHTNRHLLDRAVVLDAIYAKVRKDDQLELLSEINRSSESPAEEFELIYHGLHGIYPEEGKGLEIAHQTKSLAVIFLICTSYLVQSNAVPDAISERLKLPEFEKISDLVGVLSGINRKIKPHTLFDYPEFGYPVCNALLDAGMIEECKQLFALQREDNDDVFYKYVYDRLLLIENEFKEAEKILIEIKGILKNTNFDRLGLIINIEKGDSTDFNMLLSSMQKHGTISTRDLENMRRAIQRTGRWEFADIIIGLLWPNREHDLALLRINRDLSSNRNDMQKALELSRKIISEGRWDTEDLMKHLMLLQTTSITQDLLDFLEEVGESSRDADTEVVLADHYFDNGLFSKAYLHYSRAKELGHNMSGLKKYAEVLLEMNRLEEAASITESCNDSLLSSKLYGKMLNIPKIIELIQKIEANDVHFKEVFTSIIENFWNNPEVKYEIIKRYINGDNEYLGLQIIRKCLLENDVKTAIGLSRELFNKHFSCDSAIYYSKALYSSGEHDEAKRILSKTLNKCQNEDERMRILNELYSTLYSDGDFDSVISLFSENPESVSKEAVRMVIDSYTNLGLLDEAERTANRFYETLVDKETFSKIEDKIEVQRRFLETLKYVKNLMKEEYTLRRRLITNEEFYAADIPIDRINDVRNFLKIREKSEMGLRELESLTSQIIPKLVKGYGIKDTSDLSIYMIYNNMEKPDPIIARDLYFYIKDQVEQQKIPVVDNPDLTKLAKIAMKKYIELNPFIMSSELDIGISKAIDVITLLRYLSEMNIGSET